MEQRLTQTQRQQLILSPQLRQYLKLLQLPLAELELSVEEELTQNPILEETSPAEDKVSADAVVSDDATSDSRDEELRFDQTLDALRSIDEEARETLYHSHDLSEDDPADLVRKNDYRQSLLSTTPTLANYLEWQLGLLSLTEEEQAVTMEIIGNINDDGYFAASVEEVAQAIKQSAEKVERVLRVIQTLDPPGVGGRNLAEVLLIQLKRKEAGPLPKKIVEHHLDLLQKKQWDALVKALATAPEHVAHAVQIISKLEPKPGRIFYQNESISVVPDIIITRKEIEKDEEDPGYDIEINHDTIPELRINRKYRMMLMDKKLDKATKVFLREKMKSALMFVRALGERKSTLRRLAEELVVIQKEFLDRGFAYLKPLRLRDLAEKLGLHESTISRAIHEKYVSCPQGTIPLKSFFSSSMTREDGSRGDSQKSIMEKIKAMIETETKQKPLSDTDIVKMLETEGIRIARRTVAKYRELQRILPTHLRKSK